MLCVLDENVLKTPRKGDSCKYDGKKFYIKSIGQTYTVLITVTDYIRYGLRGRNPMGDKVPTGFRVKTSEIKKIRYNYWNV